MMSENLKTTRPGLASPWIFFVATFVWTWSFWGLAIALGVSMESAAGFPLLFLGVIGPAVMGIAFTYLTRDRDGRRDYWKRVVDFRRIGARWWLVILLSAPLANGLAALLDATTGGGGTTWGETALNALANPFAILLSIVFSTLIPFIEELGWRGYVLDRLQDKWSALVASSILGVIWSLWHLPLFFIQGSYQAGLGVGTLAFWSFMIGIVPLTLLFTWIFNNTRRSTLAVILFHGMVNFTGELIALSIRADAMATMLWFVAAAAITILWGADNLRRTEEAYA
jgi:membrane protease YdiL (CAAX protease family)